MTDYGVLIVFRNGRLEYLQDFPSHERAEFGTKQEAEDAADFVRHGLVPDEALGVHVVSLDENAAVREGGA